MFNCANPIRVKVYNRVQHRDVLCYVPCGRCYHCINKNVNEWRQRLMWTYKYSHSCAFVTLTVAPRFYKQILNNPKREVQNFLKRFRKNHPYDTKSLNFKYYVCSELGHDKGRLHFHVLFFNQLLSGESLYQLIKKCWKYGIIDVSKRPIGEKAINYVTKYILNRTFRPKPKKILCDEKRVFNSKTYYSYHYESIKPKEWYWSLKSNGIGTECLTKHFANYLLNNNGSYLVDSKFGKKQVFVCKYIFNKLEPFNSQKYEQLKNQRYNKFFDTSSETALGVYSFYAGDCIDEETGLISKPFEEYGREFAQIRESAILKSSQLKTKYKFKSPPNVDFFPN